MRNIIRCLLGLTVVFGCGLSFGQQVELQDNFYYIDGEKFFVKGIGYGVGAGPGQLPWNRTFDPDQLHFDIGRIEAAGFNTIRTWEPFTEQELDVVAQYDVKIIMGIWVDPHGDFADPFFRDQAKDIVSDVMDYSADYDNIIGYLIMNEPLPEVIFDAGYAESVSLWQELAAIIHQAHPNRPVAIANTSNGTYIDADIFDYAIYNAYIYNPVTVNYLHTYQSFMHSLRDSFNRDAPLIVSEFGLSVSPTGPGNWGYGGNTLQEQTDGILHMYRSLVDGGASGACVFIYNDGWWKGGNEFVHDDHVEEWFGLVEYQSLNDQEGTPRPAWHAVSAYQSAIITEPRTGEIYSDQVPVEFFPSDEIAQMYAIVGQDTMLDLFNFQGHVTHMIDFQTSGVNDYVIDFHFYNQSNQLVKEETKTILVAPNGIDLPTVDVQIGNADFWDEGQVDVTYFIEHQSDFEVISEIEHIFYPHIGFNYGSAFETPMPPGQFATIDRNYTFNDNVDALTVGAAFDVRYGDFETRIVGERIVSRADSVVTTSVRQLAPGTAELIVYPNPVGDVLYIASFNGNMTNFEIIDLMGRILDKGVVYNNGQIDVSELSCGQYLLRCTNVNGDTPTLSNFVKI